MDLRSDGIFSLGQILDQDSCRELEDFTSGLPYYICHSEVDAVRERLELCTDNKVNHHYKVYRLTDLLSSATIRRIASFPYLHSIANDYLGDENHLSSIILWKSYPTKQPAVAQQFHRDVCKEKSLAAFIYLTDVSATNGPHTYIRYSHDDRAFEKALSGKEKQLLRAAKFRWRPTNVVHLMKAIPHWRGLVNKTHIINGVAYDLDRAFQKVAPEFLYTHTGPAGSCLLTEPRGLHRGDPVTEGHRTMLSLRWNIGKQPNTNHYDFDHKKPEYGGNRSLLNDIQALLKQVSVRRSS